MHFERFTMRECGSISLASELVHYAEKETARLSSVDDAGLRMAERWLEEMIPVHHMGCT